MVEYLSGYSSYLELWITEFLLTESLATEDCTGVQKRPFPDCVVWAQLFKTNDVVS